MPTPELELDERFFEVLARNDVCVITKHRITGTLGIWRLEWRDRGNYPPGFEAGAWAEFLRGG